ncbi:4-hydroxy-tetrahydrodipicolinate synthase [Nocardia puris]|uniref:4-hydroxy-tetrahydrodipicolinate synthase n=2 Tax=Nocardia puris TaxID=208602 RepID=A0A366DVH8_9NOCA|nr:4-hydroxy-tetrahydrodipicolinate synthase [Nocardia puris]
MSVVREAEGMDGLQGIFVPLVTPFAADGSVAWDALESLARSVLDAGASGLVALGTTAEVAALEPDERRGVIDLCARVCAVSGAALIVGVGGNDTRTSAGAVAELAAWSHVSAAMVPVPYYTRPSEAGVVAHFAQVAAASPVPVVAYHIPYRTGRTLGAESMRRIAALPGVVGVKYAVGAVDADAVDLLGDPPTDFAVLVGDDTFAGPMFALGAQGGILATAQLDPHGYIALERAWRTGDFAFARSLGGRLARLSAAAFAEPNPTVIKGVLHAQGLIPTPDVRLPLLPAAPDSVANALAVIAREGLGAPLAV